MHAVGHGNAAYKHMHVTAHLAPVLEAVLQSQRRCHGVRQLADVIALSARRRGYAVFCKSPARDLTAQRQTLCRLHTGERCAGVPRSNPQRWLAPLNAVCSINSSRDAFKPMFTPQGQSKFEGDCRAVSSAEQILFVLDCSKAIPAPQEWR